jgi:hypothetical protein
MVRGKAEGNYMTKMIGLYKSETSNYISEWKDGEEDLTKRINLKIDDSKYINGL